MSAYVSPTWVNNAEPAISATRMQGITDTLENTQVLKFSNKSVLISDWISDTTYPDYNYRASVALVGITSDHIPMVIFSSEDASSGNYSSIVASYSGGVYLYAKDIPSSSIIIQTIICIKGVV